MSEDPTIKAMLDDPYSVIGARGLRAVLDLDVAHVGTGSLIGALTMIGPMVGSMNALRLQSRHVSQNTAAMVAICKIAEVESVEELIEMLVARQTDIVDELNARLDGVDDEEIDARGSGHG